VFFFPIVFPWIPGLTPLSGLFQAKKTFLSRFQFQYIFFSPPCSRPSFFFCHPSSQLYYSSHCPLRKTFAQAVLRPPGWLRFQCPQLPASTSTAGTTCVFIPHSGAGRFENRSVFFFDMPFRRPCLSCHLPYPTQWSLPR